MPILVSLKSRAQGTPASLFCSYLVNGLTLQFEFSTFFFFFFTHSFYLWKCINCWLINKKLVFVSKRYWAALIPWMLLSILHVSVFPLSFFWKQRVLWWNTREVARSFSHYPSWSGELEQAESTVGGSSAREGSPLFPSRDRCCPRAVALAPPYPTAQGWTRGSAFSPLSLRATHLGRKGWEPKELHCRVGFVIES